MVTKRLIDVISTQTSADYKKIKIDEWKKKTSLQILIIYEQTLLVDNVDMTN